MSPTSWMPAIGGFILIAAICYFGFQSADSAGLAQKTGSAVIISKEHVPVHKTYRTDYIAGHTRVIPEVVPEMYVFRLRVGDLETTFAVDHALYDAEQNGDKLAISYQESRFTKKLQVLSVRPESR